MYCMNHVCMMMHDVFIIYNIYIYIIFCRMIFYIMLYYFVMSDNIIFHWHYITLFCIVLYRILLYSFICRDACHTYNIHMSSLIHSFVAAKALMFEAFQRNLDVDAVKTTWNFCYHVGDSFRTSNVHPGTDSNEHMRLSEILIPSLKSTWKWNFSILET